MRIPTLRLLSAATAPTLRARCMSTPRVLVAAVTRKLGSSRANILRTNTVLPDATVLVLLTSNFGPSSSILTTEAAITASSSATSSSRPISVFMKSSTKTSILAHGLLQTKSPIVRKRYALSSGTVFPHPATIEDGVAKPPVKACPYFGTLGPPYIVTATRRIATGNPALWASATSRSWELRSYALTRSAHRAATASDLADAHSRRAACFQATYSALFPPQPAK